MTENEEFIYDSIFNQVRMGFLSIDEIKENINEEVSDNQFDEEISEEWTNSTIEETYSNRQLESKTWQKPTDTERLIKAFDDLCNNNIIALHNAGYTTSDGECEVVEVEMNLRENGITSNGYCFYHEQDLSRAISLENPSLYIAFQKVDNTNDNVTIEVGKQVVKALREQGFEIEWNEVATSKILISNFKWQYLYDHNKRDLQDYDQVIDMMTQKIQASSTNNRNMTNSDKKKKTNKISLWDKLKSLWS